MRMFLYARRTLGLMLLTGCLAAGVTRAADTAINVADEKQLFLDRTFIDQSEKIAVTMNPPVKLGPVLKPDRRWEDFRLTSYFTVVQDGELFRMYYSSFSEDQWNFAPSEVTWRDYAFLCYAESRDGVQWTKPELGIVEYEGSKKNNIIARSIVDGTVFIDPTAPKEERYKMLSTIGPHAGGLRVSHSADGIHFTIARDPVKDWGPDSQQNAFYDPSIKQYVAYLRARPNMGVEVKRRSVARVAMDDITKPWSDVKPQLVFASDDKDPEDVDFYTNAGVKYPWAANAYFFFPATYHHFPKEFGNDGLLDSSIAVSRDGIAWQRPDRRPYVSLGEQGEWDAAFIMMGVGMVRKGDKLYQYYNGIDISHGGTRKESKAVKESGTESRRRWGWMGAVEQRLDGFFSADAAYEGGSLTTPPIIFSGKRLELNINTSSAGNARVAILDAAGTPIPGFGIADCDNIMTNNVRHAVAWKGNGDVSALAGKPVRLRFEMRSAKLYAFQFAK